MTYLFNVEFFISLYMFLYNASLERQLQNLCSTIIIYLDFNFSSLFQSFLLDESNLKQTKNVSTISKRVFEFIYHLFHLIENFVIVKGSSCGHFYTTKETLVGKQKYTVYSKLNLQGIDFFSCCLKKKVKKKIKKGGE